MTSFYMVEHLLFCEQIIDSKANFEQPNVPPMDVANASKHVVQIVKVRFFNLQSLICSLKDELLVTTNVSTTHWILEVPCQNA
jgi:hypothetical protein